MIIEPDESQTFNASVVMDIVFELSRRNRNEQFRIPIGEENRLVVFKNIKTSRPPVKPNGVFAEEGFEIELAVDRSFRYTGFLKILETKTHPSGRGNSHQVHAMELKLDIFEPTTLEEAEHHLMLIRLTM